jgi:hypothetical protein
VQDWSIVEFAREEIFDDPDKIIARNLNQCKIALLGNSSSCSRALLVIDHFRSRQGSSKGSETRLPIGTHKVLVN